MKTESQFQQNMTVFPTKIKRKVIIVMSNIAQVYTHADMNFIKVRYTLNVKPPSIIFPRLQENALNTEEMTSQETVLLKG